MPHTSLEEIYKISEAVPIEPLFCLGWGDSILIESGHVLDAAGSILETARNFIDEEKFELSLGVAQDLCVEDIENTCQHESIKSFCLFVRNRSKDSNKSLKWISFNLLEIGDRPDEVVVRRPGIGDGDIVFNIFAPIIHKTIKCPGGYAEDHFLSFLDMDTRDICYTCKNPHKK